MTRAAAASASLPTRDHLMMQLALFAADPPMPNLPDEALAMALAAVKALPPLTPFRLWRVGSRLDGNGAASDIDLVLSPVRPECSPQDAEIDAALLAVRAFGIRFRPHPLPLDPAYREAGPVTTPAPLLPNTVLTSVQLLSPLRMQEVLSGKLPGFRPVGRYSIAFARAADETNYYRKLPQRDFGGTVWPYLRPAAEVLPA